MYCPKCGTENSDDAQVCAKCSQPLSSVEPQPAAAAEPPKTSGMAITSLVLGACGFCLGILTALPSLILGIISLGKINNSNGQLKGRGLAIGGIVIASVAMVLQLITMVAIMLPALAQVRFAAQKLQCASNLSSLGWGMNVYINDFDEKYPTPENWCDLLVQYVDFEENPFVCPGGKRNSDMGRSHYAINPKATPNSPPDMVLLFETTGGWNQSGGPELLSAENHQGDGANITFCDFHVKFVKKEELENLRWEP